MAIRKDKVPRVGRQDGAAKHLDTMLITKKNFSVLTWHGSTSAFHALLIAHEPFRC